MGSTFLGLTIGYSGLSAYQGALNTTANNIANVKTEGYTRQTTIRSAAEGLRSYTKYGMVGTGVQVTDITQTRSFYYDMKYWSNNAAYGEFDMKNYYMKQVQSYYYYNEDKNGINQMLSNVCTSMEDLLNNPTDLSTRNSFISTGEGLADQLNEFAIALERLQKECNDQIKIKVDEVNNIARQIATLNKQINTIELAGITANDLRDQRALLVDKLSAVADVEVEESALPSNMRDSHGEYIQTGTTCYRVTIGGQTLVNDFHYDQLKVVPRTEKLNQSDADGLYDIVWENETSFNMCNENLGGELQGLIQMRDGNNAENLKGSVKTIDAANDTIVMKGASNTDINKMFLPEQGKITIEYREFAYDSFSFDPESGEYTFHLAKDLTPEVADIIKNGNIVVGNTVDYMGIPYYMNMLNEFARSYAKAVNDIHQSGVDLNGDKGGLFFTGTHEIMGSQFGFADGDAVGTGKDTYYCITAKNFCVSSALAKDPSLLATASEIGNGPARTDVLQELKDMHSKPVISNFTPTEFFERLLSDIAIATKDSKDMTDNYQTLGNVIQNQRLSVAGVDEDEEALDLVKFQNAYNLNSKLISIMNECYNKLINETGV